MRLYRPHSFFTLLVIAFFFVCLPLLVALYNSVQIMDDLVDRGVAAVNSSVERVNRSREVVELIQNQERMARLYSVLGEPAQLQNVLSTQNEIETTLNTLRDPNGNEQLNQLVEELELLVSHVGSVLSRTASGPEILKSEKQKVLENYKEIDGLTSAMVRISNRIMTDEVNAMKLKVAQDKRMLVLLTLGLIFFTVIFIILFISLIFKPIRQINQSIESLGEGNFQTPISVSGPTDLENLGTKLDWLRKRLAKLEREKVKMIAHISHDLKTPLASIREGSGLLQDGLVGPMNKQQRDVVRILEKNCTKLQKLIEDILNFNMAKAREIPLETELVQLDEIIDEVAGDHQNSIMARNIHLDLQLDSVAMYGNQKQLRAVFDNLLSNAVKFTPENGSIQIQLKKNGEVAECLVMDSGRGIDEEDRSQIFSPFFKGTGAEQSVIKGSGLGLAISKEYIHYHGGTIRSVHKENGACFIVTLPLKE